MIRKIILLLVAMCTVFMLILTVQRWLLNYNENGEYFDGTVTYDSDARLTYTVITLLLLILASVLVLRNIAKSAADRKG